MERHLGAGAAADVYQVRHQTLGSRHALKLTHFTSRPALTRMLQEGRFQASLRHPNVVPVHDVLNVDGRCALLLELVEGPSLDRVLRARRLGVAQVDALARGILAGVAAAHQRGLIHRDLKPANVLLECSHGSITPRISDFGIARSLQGESDSGTRTGVAMGTPDYMPPEQIRSAARADARSDVFALGAMLYELLAGAPPIVSDNLIDRHQRLMERAWRPLEERAPETPRRMLRAIEQALQPEPDARPADAAALLRLWEDGTPAPTEVWPAAILRGLQELAGFAPLTPTLDSGEHRDAPPALEVPAWSSRAAPVVAPKPRPPAPPQGEIEVDELAFTRSRRWWGLGMAGALVLLLVLIVAGGWGGDPPAPVEAPEAGAAGEPTADAAQLPPTAPAPASPGADEAASVAAPPRPKPVAEAASPSGGPPRAPAEVAPSGSPPVAPASEPPPAPPPPEPVRVAPARAEAPPPRPGTSWALRGVERGHLVAGDGSQYPPGTVPPGTYMLHVFFPGDAHAEPVRQLTLSADARVTVRCEPTLRSCQ